ncbi:hypothetical protein PENTCL1PPCAC_30515, partial [Pristionchus entomophagus]
NDSSFEKLHIDSSYHLDNDLPMANIHTPSLLLQRHSNSSSFHQVTLFCSFCVTTHFSNRRQTDESRRGAFPTIPCSSRDFSTC